MRHGHASLLISLVAARVLAQDSDREQILAATPGGTVEIHADVASGAVGAASIGARPVPIAKPAPEPPSAPPPPPTPSPRPKEPPIPIPAPEALSQDARDIAEALATLESSIGAPLQVVQCIAFGHATLTLAVASGLGQVLEHTYSQGKIDAKPLQTDCKKALAPGKLDLTRFPAIWDDARRRAGSPEGSVLQIIASQYPCGTVTVRVAIEGRISVYYTGDGRFQRVER